jgi:hypothetical protein
MVRLRTYTGIGAYRRRSSQGTDPAPPRACARSIEPYTSNIYTRRVLSGEFQVVNPHLLRDLVRHGLWSEEMKNAIIACNGSVQRIDAIPDDLKGMRIPPLRRACPQPAGPAMRMPACVGPCALMSLWAMHSAVQDGVGDFAKGRD